MERVIVGMSGGVDSAVAAALLLKQGYEVHGVTLKMWKMPQEQPATDPITVDAVAEAIGVPLVKLDLTDRFYREIVSSFADAYLAGTTPNPCVYCNPTLKFRALLDVAHDFNARWIATGHYARVKHQNGMSHLLRGKARNKDQSYALHRLTQEHLQHIIFPLGEMEEKAHVRELARKLEIPSADKTDSQDLCFMGGGDYRTLIQTLKADYHQPGQIHDENGQVLGVHNGIAFYTIGQRSGLGISSSQRLYVTRIDAKQNAVVVGPRSSLEKSNCQLESLTFTSGVKPGDTFSAMGRFRYRSPEVPIEVTLMSDTQANIHFIQPQQMIAPGQSLVFYRDDEVLGGGIITNPS